MLHVPMYFYDEVFTWATSEMIPGVEEDRYLVGNYGTVYDTRLNCYNNIYKNSLSGYCNVRFNINGKNSNLSWHRTVALAHIPGDRNLQVNHINGIKSDCGHENLEWVTPADNDRHAIENGLRRDNDREKLSDEEVHRVCKMLEDGYNYRQIATALGKDFNRIYRTLFAIKSRTRRTNISSQYNFDSSIILTNKDRKLSRDVVHKICQVLSEKGVNTPSSVIMEEVGLIPADSAEKLSYQYLFHNIKSRTSYMDISKHYNF